MPYGITQCYLPPNSGDFSAFTPTKAATRFNDPRGMQGWVKLGGGYIVYPQKTINYHRNKLKITTQCHGRELNL